MKIKRAKVYPHRGDAWIAEIRKCFLDSNYVVTNIEEEDKELLIYGTRADIKGAILLAKVVNMPYEVRYVDTSQYAYITYNPRG